ncbi:unnamed protein product [Didymodactylos carnosus]|uniref:Uncharacterized protein n=1 Tax=Didymodactylos carnosus TaxID=1234261 RepID=A0A815B677_9BILA|nr:unnamed protein product [Didymodactylos carnosus]CAF1266164.1 unnamed protein product [Didymodactylos carnosus]CAF3850719.1 unnamed protein product [Didymodactylos carnosus]CAF4049349.1 unnamed protein product [Didymodactylos carnosus]
MTTLVPITLNIKTVFGVRSSVENGLYFQDDHVIVYPAGNQLIISNVETKGQKNFCCPELENLLYFIVHGGAAITAIVAQGDKENIIVAFYDLHIGRRKRLFEIRNSITSIVSLAFSHDAKQVKHDAF